MHGHFPYDWVRFIMPRETSRKTIEDTPVIRLAAEDQRRFAQMLLDPAPLAPAMERARAAHARLTQE